MKILDFYIGDTVQIKQIKVPVGAKPLHVSEKFILTFLISSDMTESVSRTVYLLPYNKELDFEIDNVVYVGCVANLYYVFVGLYD